MDASSVNAMGNDRENVGKVKVKEIIENGGMWPNFFIVGAVKCGTTWLWARLRKHPEVFLPELKEPHFFLGPQPHFQEGDEVVDQHCAGDLEAYHQLYQGAQGFRAIGDASPSYLWDEGAPYRIREVCPQARIVIILRDPVIRAHSRYLMNFEIGIETLPFWEALQRDRERERRFWWTARLYVECGLYYSQVRRFLELFGKEQVLVLLFEDLIKRPHDLLSRVTDHIGVDAAYLDASDLSDPLNPYRRQRFGRAYNLTSRLISRQVRQRLFPPAVSRWLRYNSLLYDTKKPPLDAESRRYLEEIYDPDIAKLEELMRRKLPELRKSWGAGVRT